MQTLEIPQGYVFALSKEESTKEKLQELKPLLAKLVLPGQTYYVEFFPQTACSFCGHKIFSKPIRSKITSRQNWLPTINEINVSYCQHDLDNPPFDDAAKLTKLFCFIPTKEVERILQLLIEKIK